MSTELNNTIEGKAIGCILYNQRNLDECLMAGLVPEDFASFPCQGAYRAAMQLSDENEPITVLNLVSKMALNGQASGVLVTLSQLADQAGDYWVIKDIIRELRRTSLRRRVVAAAELIALTVKSSEHWTEAEILEWTEKQLSNLRPVAPADKIITAHKMVTDVMDQLESFHQGVVPGMKTGLKYLDFYTGGIKAGQAWIIAARPSMGKSSMLSQIVDHCCVEDGIPTGIFSMEMSHVEWGHNMLHAKAMVDNRLAQDRKLHDSDYFLLGNNAMKIAKAPMEICTQGELSIHQLRGIARQMKRRFGAKLFAVDYLQLASSKTKHGEGREREIAQVSNGLKAMAKELDAGVVVACQLNRMGDESGKPRMSWLRESGQIEADADFIGVIYQPDQKDFRNLSIYILKQRSGPRFIDIPVHFRKEYTKFETIEKHDHPSMP